MWRNRQTRWIQVPVVATPCGFKSHHPHQKKSYGLAVALLFFDEKDWTIIFFVIIF